MSTIYFFSGLGADERVFANLELKNCNKIYVQWILPLKNETLSDYSFRLIKDIIAEDAIFIGLSFGGIVASEVAKRFKVSKLILISSVRNEKEIPLYYKWLRFIPLYKLIPASFISKPNFFINGFFGVKSREEKNLLKQILSDTPVSFFRWAVGVILNWKNNSTGLDTIHIHGSEDKIIPLKYVTPDDVVANGGHFMVYSRAEEVSRLLNDIIG